MKLRRADVTDIKPGAVLFDTEGNRFCVRAQYAPGLWESLGQGGGKLVFECEAEFYLVEVKS